MEEVVGSGEVRVATLNLWGRHGNWDERRSVLVDGLLKLQADIIAFQEVVLTEGYDQVADLLGASYHVIHQAGRDAEGTGLSIASRWEVREVWEETLHVSPRGDPGGIAVAEILAPDPLGTLFVAHRLVAIGLRARARAAGYGSLAPRRGSTRRAGGEPRGISR